MPLPVSVPLLLCVLSANTCIYVCYRAHAHKMLYTPDASANYSSLI